MTAIQIAFWVVALLVVLAIAFDFMNGFHDAANSIATVVSTGVLKPQQAVVFAAFFNVVAIFVFHLSVAATIGKGIVEPGVVDHHVVFGALIGAIIWNVVTWWYGIPSSSSHALIGGIVGAVIAKAGHGALIAAGVGKTVLFIFVSPVLGFLLGALLMVRGGQRLPARLAAAGRQPVPPPAAGVGRPLQPRPRRQRRAEDDRHHLDAADRLRLRQARRDPLPPAWVIWCCYIAIGLGTMFGGWRIVKTMGQSITKLKPVGGFCAETGGAITLFLATALGIPVSTTHTITGSIVGVARCAAPRRCAGASPATSSGPGSSRSRPRRFVAAVFYGSACG